MIVWLAPWGLLGLALAGVPVLVHMLARRRATRVVFPGVRFVRPMQASSVRLQRPSDLPVLLLRIGIVIAAVLGSAQPLFLTHGRLARWNSRISRAIVIDPDGHPPEGLLAAVQRGAWASRAVTGASLREGLERGLAWLAAQPASRREIVMVSALSESSLDAADIARIPPAIGLSFVRTGRGAAPPRPGSAIDGWHDASLLPNLSVTDTATQVDWISGPPVPVPAPWLTVEAASGDEAAAIRARAAAVVDGARRDGPVPTIVAFDGASERMGDTTLPKAWLPSLRRLEVNPLLHDAASEGQASGAPVPREAVALVRDRDGHPMAWAFGQAGSLVIRVAAPASSDLAPGFIRAAVESLPAPLANGRDEVRTIDDAILRGWRRSAATGSRIDGTRETESDGRWFWAAAVVLLAVEQWGRLARRRDREALARAA